MINLDLTNKEVWFVGSSLSDGDKTQEMIDSGTWFHDYEYNEKNKIHYTKTNKMEIGDLIAIKSSYTREKNTPFDTKGHSLSVMCIKARGVIIETSRDGMSVKVNWDKKFNAKEWYFFTNLHTIWKIKFDSSDWRKKALIEFVFSDKQQDIDSFRNHSRYKNRFGTDDVKFEWIDFYEELTYKLLDYEENREELLEIISKTFENIGMSNPMVKGEGYIENDICPFTFFATFNRGIREENKIRILENYKEYLDIDAEVPKSFNGIPEANNMSTWFYGDRESRKEKDIDNLWELYKSALDFSKDQAKSRNFIKYFDIVKTQFVIGVSKLTMGLFWISPNHFLPLDLNTKRVLIRDLEDLELDNKFLNTINGDDYINLNKVVVNAINSKKYSYTSIPDLSYSAWLKEPDGELEDEQELSSEEIDEYIVELETYDKYDFLEESFIDEEEYETIVSLIGRKKNIILQGSPGVGKTFTAKRLAYSILGVKDDSKIKMIQFHQNYSYEDFIEGYRPREDGGFTLKKGPFYQFCKKAESDKDSKYFFIIDEINRGNLSKIFGELMVLIEEDKRRDKINLVYSTEEFSVPENLYIVGMMNTADRSIAIIDYALRRRFVFYELLPAFDSSKFKEHLRLYKTDEDMINKVIGNLNMINREIEEDVSLGSGFAIGHSYFSGGNISEDVYREIVKYEIAPLIREYWFDQKDKAEGYIEELLGD